MNLEFQKLDVLYIEDNLGDFFLIEEYLLDKFENVAISQCSKFERAKEVIESKNDFNVILLDIQLSDNGGVGLIESILEIRNKDIPVIILTGFADKQLAKQSISMGVSDFLIKDELTAETLKKSILLALK